jgi:hypothetical protein
MERRKENMYRMFKTIWKFNASFTKVADEYRSLLAKIDGTRCIAKLRINSIPMPLSEQVFTSKEVPIGGPAWYYMHNRYLNSQF